MKETRSWADIIMASSGLPTPVSKRSFSLPTPRPAGGDSEIEILYVIPGTRIISFSSSSSPNGIPGREEEPGSLLWTSRFERTIAVGMRLGLVGLM